jgi:hypothetical protein
MPPQPPENSTTEVTASAGIADPAGQPTLLGTPAPVPAASAKINTLAIVSIISAFFLHLAGIITGIIALVQIKKTGQRGRGLAITGIIVGGLGLLVWITLTILLVLAATVAAAEASTHTADADNSASEPWEYGDDAYLDSLYDACAVGDNAACEDLFQEAPAGSAYEDFGWSCGVTGGNLCGGTASDTDGSTGDALSADDQAYLAQVRTAMATILEESDLLPATFEMITQLYTDEILVAFGEAAVNSGGLDQGTFVEDAAKGPGGFLPEPEAVRLYDAIVTAAKAHLN